MTENITLLVDGMTLHVKKDIIEISVYIKNFIENMIADGDQSIDNDSTGSNDIVIKIENTDYETMKRVLMWCEHYFSVNGKLETENNSTNGNKWSEDILKEHEAMKAYDVPLDNWDREFLNVSVDELSKIIAAADFLNIQPLLISCCKVIAQHFRGKSPKAVIEAFARASNNACN